MRVPSLRGVMAITSPLSFLNPANIRCMLSGVAETTPASRPTASATSALPLGSVMLRSEAAHSRMDSTRSSYRT
eukprot:4000144-Pyramimonas_sp.AAC.2